MGSFTHLDEKGNAVMVDVGEKPTTHRLARAVGSITLSPEAYALLQGGRVPKGDALAVARVAGIMAAKRTSEAIPLCHGLLLTKVTVDFSWHDAENRVEVACIAECLGQTGVEMEALHGATVALLTLYDMCKAIDKAMTIGGIRLMEKRGGRSGTYLREGEHA